MIYRDLVKNNNNKIEVTNTIQINFVKGAFVEITGNKKSTYVVKFTDIKSGKLLYEDTIRNNMWCKCSIEYYVNWLIDIYEDGELLHSHIFDLTNKKVYIALDSSALGDTLAWIPYIDEFRKKNNCRVVCSTFMNDLFESEYSDIEFVKPGDAVHDLYAMYTLGLFYNGVNVNLLKNPSDPKKEPLQKIASDILGVEYTEIRPKISIRTKLEPTQKVVIAIHGTTQAKYWNNPNGWQKLVDWLISKNYSVKLISREGDGYMGNSHPTGIESLPNGPIDGVIAELVSSNMFIGIGSGLSWLSWALGVKTVLISGFSYDWTEMSDCIRISPPVGVCGGCFNRVKLDAGDWNWCPDYKGTDRQYECTKSITAEMVIEKINKYL
jgi:autotransporter strand-loop-strand O-heptosyltransferase